MRILLASLRDDPTSDDSAALVVAYIYFEAHCITIEPVHSALEGTLTLEWLRNLVREVGGADPYTSLVQRRLAAWTFEAPQLH